MPGVNQTFSFDNDPAAVYPLVTEVVRFVQSKQDVEDSIITKLKAVLVEMLTNAVKHSGGHPVDMDVALEDDEVVITKRDNGNPLSIIANGVILNWPLPGNHQGGREINLYGDGAVTLRARLANNCAVSFFTEEKASADTEFDLLTLPEHFGMMIIARACYHFGYLFDIDSCTNIFTAAMRLK